MRDKLRGIELLIVAVVVFVAVEIYTPERTAGIVSMLVRMGFAAYLAYWIDRIGAPYARPHTLEGKERSAAMIRRAIIQAGALVGAGMSL